MLYCIIPPLQAFYRRFVGQESADEGMQRRCGQCGPSADDDADMARSDNCAARNERKGIIGCGDVLDRSPYSACCCGCQGADRDNHWNVAEQQGSYGRTIKGAFNNITYSDNPSRAAIQMMNDKLPFDEFIDYCKKRGINPYDYLDYNDFEVEQWIEDYI